MARAWSKDRKVHRELLLEKAGGQMRGDDVKAAQAAANTHLRKRGQHAYIVKVDGVAGPLTFRAWERIAFLLGLALTTVDACKHEGRLTEGAQRVIRNPKRRTPVQLARALARKRHKPKATASRKGAFGIDVAWGDPGTFALNAAHVDFVCRYYSHDASKNLTAARAQALAAGGVDCVAVWESTANRALGGRANGVADARAALAQANAAGQPKNTPIYFGIDFDATPGQQPVIAAYFDGVASVIGRARTGAYGGYWPLKRLLDGKKIVYAWQTYAWSGGRWDPRAQLQQYLNGRTLAGVSCDYDRAAADDFGQWRPTGKAARAQTPAVAVAHVTVPVSITPAPAPTRTSGVSPKLTVALIVTILSGLLAYVLNQTLVPITPLEQMAGQAVLVAIGAWRASPGTVTGP